MERFQVRLLGEGSLKKGLIRKKSEMGGFLNSQVKENNSFLQDYFKHFSLAIIIYGNKLWQPQARN